MYIISAIGNREAVLCFVFLAQRMNICCKFSKWSSNRTTSLFQLCYHHLLFYWKPCVYWCTVRNIQHLDHQPRDTWEISNHYSTLNKHLKHSIRFRIGKSFYSYHGTHFGMPYWKPCMCDGVYVDIHMPNMIVLYFVRWRLSMLVRIEKRDV